MWEDEDAEDDGEGKVASKRCSVCEGRLSEAACVESAEIAGNLKVAVGVWIDGHLDGGDVEDVRLCFGQSRYRLTDVQSRIAVGGDPNGQCR